MSIVSKLAGYFSLSKNLNKVQGTDNEETAEGVISDLLPELELSMSDEDLTDLSKKWRAKWETSNKKSELDKKQKENERYWLGKHFEDSDSFMGGRQLTDNLIFEALETALPVATKQNPEPMVGADNTDEGIELATTVQKMLSYLSDTLTLKLKIKRITRYWALYLLGVAKMSWNTDEDEMDIQVLRPQKLILDPDATISETGEYLGEYIGEAMEKTASELKELFPKKATFIDEQTQKQEGTTLRYTEWWTNKYVYWEMDGEVLDKAKNFHFNYKGTKSKKTDEMGVESEVETEAKNHFNSPKKPYIFFSVFNLGKQPFDDTSLIGQNLPLQDLINKRYRQIDKNADKMNGGSVWSGDVMTTEQAKEADKAIRNGGSVVVPGDVNRNHAFVQATAMPSDIFAQLNDSRNELKNIFGTRGFGAGGLAGQKTVRGMVALSQADTLRMGGEISDYLEQVVDHIFNWMVQMIYVYWDEPHTGSVVGQAKAFEFVSLQASQLDRKLTVSVKEGSMLPKDSMSEGKQAQDLATAGFLAPTDLFAKLDFPNPKETAKNLFLWKTDPIKLFPELEKEMQAQQPQQGQPPNPMGSPQGADAGQPPGTPPIQQLSAGIPQI